MLIWRRFGSEKKIFFFNEKCVILLSLIFILSGFDTTVKNEKNKFNQLIKKTAANRINNGRKNMKKCLLLLLLVTVTKVNAQSYIKMIDTSYVWDVLCGGITSNGDDVRQTDRLQFLADTLIDATIYKNLYSYTYFTKFDSILQFICPLREDTLQKKIYKRYYDSEELIFDFSLQQGDSVITYDSYGGTHHYVRYYKVDSIINIFFANKIRKKVYISEYYYRDTELWGFSQYRWLEGIGKVDNNEIILGPIDNLSPFVDRLLCFWESGQLQYLESTYYSCLIVGVGINDFENSGNINFSPNPANSVIGIELTVGVQNLVPTKTSRCKVYDILGTLIIDKTFTGNKTQLDVSGLAKSVYLLKLENEEGVAVKRFVKE